MYTFQEKKQMEHDHEICAYYAQKHGVDTVEVNNPCGKCPAAYECPIGGTFVEGRL